MEASLNSSYKIGLDWRVRNVEEDLLVGRIGCKVL
jgi:hypothetical protein